MNRQKLPPELKKITQYVRRAEELIPDETRPESHLVAYYCRQYSIQIGTPLATGPDCEVALATIVDAIDADKDAMVKFTKEEAYTTCRSLAMEVFDKADAEDRAGETGKETATNFYVAASYLDVLKYFTEEDGGRGEEAAIEEEKKSLYAKWRATDILKAIKDGRELKSEGYGDNEEGEEIEQEEVRPFIPSTRIPSSLLPLPSMPEEIGFDRAPLAHPSINRVNSMPIKSMVLMSKKPSTFGKMFRMSPQISPMDSNPAGSGYVSEKTMKKAQELTESIIEALDRKDADVVVQRLKEALKILGQ